ncbi:hypothetical protein K2Z84_08860 [Candidatus Binatia bacterium]|nr:hypothetical protein [Candidatus Binatia bacterium]
MFLASSSELSEERARFPDVMRDIDALPDVRRNLRVKEVLWETHATGGDPSDINFAIARSVDFEGLDLVVVVVRNKIGRGTEGEFARALELWRLHDRPQLLVLARTPSADADPVRVAEVETFLRSVVDAHVVPTRYGTIDRFVELLRESVPSAILKPDPHPEPAPPDALRRWFTASSAVSVLLSAASIALVQMISYPSSGVNQGSILATLIAPVLLFLSLTCSIFLYDRLLRGLKRVWFSRSWRDASLYASIRHVVPGFCLPSQLRASVPLGVAPSLVAVLWLALVLGAPIYAQGLVLFREITTWDVVVGWAATPGQDGHEVSTFVDRGGLKSWLLGIQDPAARDAYEKDPNEITYVHAHGAFGSSGGSADNRGPQVWLPAQGLLYLAMFLASIGVVLAVFARIARLPVTLMRTQRRR